MKKLILIITAVLMTLFMTVPASAFSFSEAEEEEAREEQAQQAKTQKKIKQLLSVRCQRQLKKKKIAVILGRDNARENSEILFMEVNDKLQRLGLKTYSQKEISAQIAQAEMDAFLSNNMDAAASAARRLKADFMLRGIIRSKTRINPIVHVNEVSINMVFTLIDSAGRIISNVSAHDENYSGQNTLEAALSMVKEKSGLMVAQLYHDYCAQGPIKGNTSIHKKSQPKPTVKVAPKSQVAPKAKVQNIEDF